MFSYKPRKNKKNVTNSGKNKNYVKQQNLAVDSLNEKNINELQNSIGNKQTMSLLKELGNLDTDKNLDIESLLFSEANSSETKQVNSNIKDFKNLSKENNMNSYDAVKSGRFSLNNNNQNKPKVNVSNVNRNLEDLVQMVNYFKLYDSTVDKKSEEIKVADEMKNPQKDKIRAEVESVLNMIKALPNFDNNPGVISKYMKVQNLLVSSGCNIKELFSNNGNVKRQKEIILKSIENK